MIKLLLIVNTFFVLAFAECDEPCSTEFKHYKELGCKPIIEEGQCCPSRYECPEITDRDGKKCYFKGKVYEGGKKIDENDVAGLCAEGCFCQESVDSTKSSFVCASLDCAEFFQPYDPDCIRQYNNASCCAIKTICGEEKNKLAECYVDGERYLEGQKMYPKDNTCHYCLCKNGFDNSTVLDNENCMELSCGIELRDIDKVDEGCLPIYFGENRCCPIGWRCPEAQDKIVPESRTTSDANSKFQCKFGKLVMNLGDTVSTGDNKCTTCKCLVPPIAHCVQDPNC